MPMYEWVCDTCGCREDGFRAVAERHDAPACHGRAMSIVIGAPAVQADLPGYQSPTTGRWIEGRAARRDDLARSHARPYEGFEAEKREAERRTAEIETRADRKLDAAVRESYHSLTPAQRRVLESP